MLVLVAMMMMVMMILLILVTKLGSTFGKYFLHMVFSIMKQSDVLESSDTFVTKHWN